MNFSIMRTNAAHGHVLRKTLLIMKITTYLLLIAVMTVSASTLAQKITLNEQQASLEKVLDKIRVQSGYDFLYNYSAVDKSRPVTVHIKNASVDQALEAVFSNQPLTYEITNQTVVVKGKSFFQKLKEQVANALATPFNVSGIITDKLNQPLAGATVIIKRTNQGTTTDNRGFYTLTNVDATDSIVVRFIGYKSLTVAVGKLPFHNLKLEEATSGLDEVVIQAYGKTTQRLTTGSIARITAEEIEKQPVNDLLLSLTGRVPGLQITPQTGFNGGAIKVQIRGRNAINPGFSSDPLYIVDGVPFTVLDLQDPVKRVEMTTTGVSRGLDQAGLSYSLGQDPLYGLNPLDIESIEVLKDADATSIYGSRAANGVILITTKKGKPGASQVTLSLQDGVNFATRSLALLNTPDYLAMRRQAFKNDGIIPTALTAPDLFLADPNAYTNWQKFAYGHAGKRLDLQGSLSGGTDQTAFRLSGGYNTTKDITDASDGDKKATLSFNMTNNSANKRFYTAFTVNYNYAELNQLSLSGFNNLPPNAPSAYDASGSPNFAGYHAVGMKYPFAKLFQLYNSKNTGVNGNLTLKYTIIKGLNATVSLGYNSNQTNSTLFKPMASQSPYDNGTTPITGSASFGNTRVNNWIAEPQVTYDRLIGKGKLDLLAGATVQSNTTQGITNNGTNYTSDLFIKSIQLAPTMTVLDNYGQYKYAGIFGRINYVWDNKYIININARRDGSSRFGPGKQFGNFGSAGLAWIASEEKWLKDILPQAIDFFKLRGSYGTTGSDLVGDYKFLSQWGNASPILTSYNGVVPLTPQLMANPDYHWQVNKKLDLAMDMELLNGAISFGVDYYRDRCDNQLVSLQTPEFTGFTSVVANNPANVQNTGLEFTLTTNVAKGKNFSWRNSFNIAFNRNKLLAYPGLETSPYRNQYKVGQSLENVYVFHFTGIDPLTGLNTYEDHNGDGKISDNNTVFPGTQDNDAYVMINRAPQFTGGYTTVFNYKHLQLTMVFYFAKQMGYSYLKGGVSTLGGTMNNIPQYMYDHTWSYVGQTDALYNRLSTSLVTSPSLSGSDANYEDASFIRFQTLTLRYSLPDKLLHKIGLRNLAFTVSTNNLFVITPYRGLDPQVFTLDQPLTRTVEAGLTATF